MKSFTIYLCILFVGLNSSTIEKNKVYVCKGKGSKRYHYNKHCRGLSRCSTKIYEVTLKEAKNMGRTLCGWED
nr:hypothetical protein [uncultured Allomuricauda sp.]